MRAGVGIGALYRRYRSKDELLRQLAEEGLRRYIATVEAALAARGDSRSAFDDFMRRALDAGTGSLTVRFAAGFSTTAEMHRLGQQANVLTTRLLRRMQRARVLRVDIEVGDLTLLFEQLQSVTLSTSQRTQRLRHRYLAIVLDGLRWRQSGTLPGPAPRWREISGRYRQPLNGSDVTSNRRSTRRPAGRRAGRAAPTGKPSGR